MSPELRATLDVASAFSKVGVAYYLCGSMASSAQGLPRASADVDFVADLMPHHVRPLILALGNEFEVDEEMLRDREQLKRVRLARLTRQDEAEVALPAPEDTVLAKLLWYRKGGEVSDRQWADIRGVLQVQAGQLDLEHMRRWAKNIGVSDLLERALTP